LAPTSTKNQPVFQERVIVPLEMIDINDANHEPKSISRGFRGMGKTEKKAIRMVKGMIKVGSTCNDSTEKNGRGLSGTKEPAFVC